MASLNKIISSLQDKHRDAVQAMRNMKTCWDKLDHVISQQLLDGLINVTPLFHDKNHKVAEQRRTEGNQLMKKKRYSEALNMYNQSILAAPHVPTTALNSCVDNNNLTKDLALAFANRSAVLFHMEKFEACLIDIATSLEHQYPVDQRYKLYDRQARCNVMLKRWRQASDSFHRVLGALEDSSIEESTRAQWKRRTTQQIEKYKNSDQVDGHSNGQESATTSNSRSTSKDSARDNGSPTFTVQQSECAGRHVVSSRPLDVGDVVMSEEPYACVLHHDYYSSHCYHCLRVVELPFPCQQCISVRYCSRRCALRSWQSCHQHECRHLTWLSESFVSKLGMLALRVLLKQHSEDSERSKSSTNRQTTTDHDVVFSQLVSHEDERDFDVDLQLITMAVLLGEVIRSSGFQESSGPAADSVDASRKLVAQILHNLHVTQCNAVAITEMVNVGDFEHCKPVDIGLGVYLKLSMLNHSCDPSADLGFSGTKCVARMIKSQSAGEEVTIDYGPVFCLEDKQARRSHLKVNYFFDCQCVACSEDWPLFGDMPGACPTFKCQKCGGTLSQLDGHSAVSKCPDCSTINFVFKTIQTLSESHENYAKANKQILRGDLTEGLPALEHHLVLMQRYLCQPWREFYSCQAVVKQCYRILATKRAQSNW